MSDCQDQSCCNPPRKELEELEETACNPPMVKDVRSRLVRPHRREGSYVVEELPE